MSYPEGAESSAQDRPGAAEAGLILTHLAEFTCRLTRRFPGPDPQEAHLSGHREGHTEFPGLRAGCRISEITCLCSYQLKKQFHFIKVNKTGRTKLVPKERSGEARIGGDEADELNVVMLSLKIIFPCYCFVSTL